MLKQQQVFTLLGLPQNLGFVVLFGMRKPLKT